MVFSPLLFGQEIAASKVVQIEQMLESLMTDLGIPGLSITVATANEQIYSRGLGIADVENSVPVTSETRFRTASVAKPMTAVVVLALAQEAVIDLDADIQTYCQEFPTKAWPLNSRHLLGHLGGVRHYRDRDEAESTNHFYSLKSALSTFDRDPLLHPPGTKFLYSTFGYNLLGSIAEGATGKTFPKLLEERVLGPSNMSRTEVDDQAAIIPGRARGYIRPSKEYLAGRPSDHNLLAGELYNASMHDTSMKIPAGGLLSTSTDLVRFAVAINKGKLLNKESVDSMWTHQKTLDGNSTDYGLGWKIESRLGRKFVSHTGGQAGTSTVLVLSPESGTVVAIMCNLQNTALMSTAIAIAGIAQPSQTAAVNHTDYSEAIKKLKIAVRKEVEQKQLPAFSISLVDQDRIVWADGFGFQDTDKKLPATAETVYRVGSVSKLFTDIAVMQLVENGMLDLDAPIGKYLPAFQPKNPFEFPITLRQLMSHRSGLVRESPIGNYFDPSSPSLPETVSSLNSTTLVYKPETKTKYSNAAIAVVGSVLESQGNAPHAKRVRESILDPLDMMSSSFEILPAIETRLATGWMRTYDARRFKAPDFLLGTGPAGNMYSSVLDLSKFLTCLFNEGQFASGRILKPETLRLMTTPVNDSDGKPQRFGLGFSVNELDGNRKIGHGGAVYGFSTQLEAIPDRKIGVVVAASLDGSNGVIDRIANYSLRLMIAVQDGKPLPDFPSTTLVAPGRAKELVGVFREKDGSRFARFTELNGSLYLQHDAFRYELRTATDGSVVTDDATGFGTRVVPTNSDELLIGGKKYLRLEDVPPRDIPDRWKGLIGEYGWDHNTLYVLEEQGELFVLIEWLYYYPLKELSDDVFLFPDSGLYLGEGLKFTRNRDGIATEVVAAEVKFTRREVGTKDGETFKIAPLKPIEQLRDIASKANPPNEQGEYFVGDLIEPTKLDDTIKLDIRYASTNNFMGAIFYTHPRAFLQRPAAESVVRIHKKLSESGLGLLIHDAYRPWAVTKMFWDATPDDLKTFVANPANGSRHNRGCAVDLSLYDRATGLPIQMVAGYDEFSARSYPLYPGGTSRQRWYRELLRRSMEAEGFTVYEYEWWHFDYRDWKKYRIGNIDFESIPSK